MAKRALKGSTASTPATTISEIILTGTPSTALTVIPTEAETITPEATPEADTRPALVTLTIFGARITNQTIIHPNLWGTERWFAKKRLTSYAKNADGSVTLILPLREIEYRDSVLTEPLATITPYEYPAETAAA